MRKKDLYNYVYPICDKTNKRAYKKARRAIEKHLKGIGKGEFLATVEYSAIRIYRYEGMKIAVFDDYNVNAVYVCSDMEIGHILGVDSIY